MYSLLQPELKSTGGLFPVNPLNGGRFDPVKNLNLRANLNFAAVPLGLVVDHINFDGYQKTRFLQETGFLKNAAYQN
jgi:hypothetical protein